MTERAQADGTQAAIVPDAAIRAAWTRICRQRALLYGVGIPLTLLAFALTGGLRGGVDDAPILAGTATSLPTVLLLLWIARCPACRRYIGQALRLRVCPKCGTRLV